MNFVFQTHDPTQFEHIYYFKIIIIYTKLRFNFILLSNKLYYCFQFYFVSLLLGVWSTSNEKYLQNGEIYYVLDKLTMDMKDDSYKPQNN